MTADDEGHRTLSAETDDAAHPTFRQPPAGHRVRRPRTGDLPRIAALYSRAAVRSRHGTTGRGALRDEDDLRRTWDARRDDALIVESGGADREVVGYLEFHEDRDPWTATLDLYAEGRVDPRADARLVGEFLLGRAHDRAVVAARRAHAADPEVVARLRTTVVDPDAATLRWFTERGLTEERHLLRLRIDVGDRSPPPRWPHGVRSRSADEVDDVAVHAALVASFDDHHLGATDDVDDWRAVRVRTGRVVQSQSLVAVTQPATGDGTDDRDGGEEVVGVALGRLAGDADPGLGIITDLGVRPAWRGRGIATALLRAAFRRFAALGAVRVALEVDDVTLDGALRLYERAGMEVVHHVIVLTTEPLGP